MSRYKRRRRRNPKNIWPKFVKKANFPERRYRKISTFSLKCNSLILGTNAQNLCMNVSSSFSMENIHLILLTWNFSTKSSRFSNKIAGIFITILEVPSGPKTNLLRLLIKLKCIKSFYRKILWICMAGSSRKIDNFKMQG